MADGLVSDTEARLRALDRRLTALRRRTEAAALAVGQAAQDVTMARSFVFGSGAAPCVATLTVTVRDTCSNATIAGVLLTATKAGRTTVTGTTNGSGVASLVVDDAGTWAVQRSKTGYQTASTNVTATCGATTTATHLITTTAGTTITVTVSGFDSLPLAGASVVATQGALTASGTTNSSGVVVLAVTATGTWSLATSKARFSTNTSNATVFTCNTNTNVNRTLTAAGGFRAIKGFADPLPETALTIIDPNGTHTALLAWDGANLKWKGCYTRSVSGKVGCATTGTVVCPITYELFPNISGLATLVRGYATCGGGNAGWPSDAGDCTTPAASNVSQSGTIAGTMDPTALTASMPDAPIAATPTIGNLVAASTVNITE